MRSVALAILAVPMFAHGARADSLDDVLGPREIAVGESMRGGATGASAVALNPAGLPLNRELVFEGGYGYRRSDSASLVSVSACDSTTAAPGCFFYDYADSSPELGGMSGSRRTHLAGMAISREILPRILFGTTAKYHNFSTDMNGEKSTSGFSFDIGTTLKLTQLISVGVVGQNLFGAEDTAQFPRAVGGGVLARPIPELTFSFDMRWKLDHASSDGGARYGGGAELFLRRGSTAFPLRAGVLRDNSLDATYASAGIGLASMSWGVDIAGRRSVAGPTDTLLLASIRFYGPREPMPAAQAE
jgi:hypothetical protein